MVNVTTREREDTTPAAVVAVNEYVIAPVRENVVVMLFNTVWVLVLSVTVPTATEPVTALSLIFRLVPAGIAKLSRAVIFCGLPDVVLTV